MKQLKAKEKQRIARESARILIEEGVDDFHVAKQKAAKRLGYNTARPLPDNDEIEIAIGEYHRLFRGQIQDSHIRTLRKTALEAMTLLENFSPRLVGNVVDGTAGQHSPAIIYLMADNPERVVISFLDARIPFVESTGHRTISGKKTNYPVLGFLIDDIRIEAHILSEFAYRECFQNRKCAPPYATIESIRITLDAAPKKNSGRF